ncbi:galactokinase [Nocardia sp. CNY236]|uniref:galactokinase n=1 Tax=Nocardia sp. CNY236 TaxID=1169152 RepID=UPI0004095008|nr:galactokinase [Nocardia sp. CNY236]
MGTWAAPGRVTVIGEHTDYNEGYALPIALPMVVRCTARSRTDGRVRVGSRQRPDQPALVAISDLATLRMRVPRWMRYPLGVVAEFTRRGFAMSGVDLELDGEVPIGAGLASSAALSCAVAVALRDLFAGDVPDRALIDIARAAENDYVGVPTGLLDQAAAILCTAGHALLLDIREFASDEPGRHGKGYEHIPFDLERFGLELLVVDTKQPHELVDGRYAARRDECAAAAAALGVTSLREVESSADVDRIAEEVLRRRARHVVTENQRVSAVVDTLRAGGDPRGIGSILTAGHASLRDDFEVSTPGVDTVVEAVMAAGAHGARMVGGGFGGSVVAVVDCARTEFVEESVRRRLAGEALPDPHVFTVVAAPGARPIV